MKKDFLIVLLSFFLIGCFGPRISIENKEKEKLLNLYGVIAFDIVSNMDNYHYSIANGELEFLGMNQCPPDCLTNKPEILFKKDILINSPKITGMEYCGPYRLSPDKSLMVFAISSERDKAINPRDILLVKWDTKEIIFQRESKETFLSDGLYFIDDIAWSPDSEMFVVLEKKGSIKLGIPWVFCAMLNHPSSEYEYFIAIYSRTGKLLMKTRVVSGAIDSSGQIYWRKTLNRETGSDQAEPTPAKDLNQK